MEGAASPGPGLLETQNKRVAYNVLFAWLWLRLIYDSGLHLLVAVAISIIDKTRHEAHDE
jgi:hypothetical protein